MYNVPFHVTKPSKDMGLLSAFSPSVHKLAEI